MPFDDELKEWKQTIRNARYADSSEKHNLINEERIKDYGYALDHIKHMKDEADKTGFIRISMQTIRPDTDTDTMVMEVSVAQKSGSAHVFSIGFSPTHVMIKPYDDNGPISGMSGTYDGTKPQGVVKAIHAIMKRAAEEP